MYGRKTRKNRHLQAYVYVLACSGGTYYVGFTRYLHNRLKLHWLGKGAYFTKKHKPLRLLEYRKAKTLADEYECWCEFAIALGHECVGGYSKKLCAEHGFPWIF